ncbi:hypothetical protein [Martelella soudanensis]|uniref:hypothetical protein n=1 Tax=unclassified Martelella TaxID=2629616 RepID=UPI0015DF9600|nr:MULTISPECIES: hypothetical protein [unclassified Martelella]
MTRRVFIGNDGGAFRFRVSMPGHDALTAADQNLTIKEGMLPLTPKEMVTATVPARSSGSPPSTVTVNTAKDYALPPFIVLKASDNTIPGEKTFYARFEPYYDRIKFYNMVGRSLTITAFIFDEVI